MTVSDILIEQDRLQALHSYGVLDSRPGPAFGRLLRLGSDAVRAASASMWLIDRDRLWCLASLGDAPSELPRPPYAAIGRLLELPAVVTCADTTNHGEEVARLGLSDLPGSVRSFALAPLTGRDGLPLGVLWFVDVVPHAFSTADLENLRSTAAQAVALLELRRYDRRQGIDPVEANEPLPDRPAQLRRALDDDEFTLRYQPLVHLEDGSVYGVEALVRWEPPDGGVLTPDRFLPALEASELMTPFGRWLRRKAVADLALLRAATTPSLGLSLNVSGRELSTRGLAQDVALVMATAGIDPGDLTLELTESARAENGAARDRELAGLAALGVGITVDDYGTGWSCLETLTLPGVNGLKIDKSFTDRLGEPRMQVIVGEVLRTARNLHATVVFEGIETETTRAQARALGATRGQGYLFAHPLRVAEFCDRYVLARS